MSAVGSQPKLLSTKQVGGLALEALVEQAEAGYARLSEALPHGWPDDLRMVASRPLLAEYERKLREAGPRLDPGLREADIAAARRQIQAVCTRLQIVLAPARMGPARRAACHRRPVAYRVIAG
jgi:hypothetical protein